MATEPPTSGLSMMQKPKAKAAAPKKKAEGETYPKFMPPGGFTPPDDAQPGDTFQATADIRVEEDGRLCLLSIDGVPFVEKEEESEEPPAPPTMSDAVAAQRDGGFGYTM